MDNSFIDGGVVMAQIKVGRQSIDTKNIAMIADTYAIVNQHGKDASSFVLTHEPANEFAKKVIAADPSTALVSTGPNGHGNFLNVNYIRDIQDYAVEMDFGTKEVDAKVPTELTKDEMHVQMDRVSDFVLQGLAERVKASTLDKDSEIVAAPYQKLTRFDSSQMRPPESPDKNNVPFMSLRSSGDVYVVSRSAADRLSKTNPEIMANSKIVDDDKFADLDKDLEVTFTPYQKATRFDSLQLGVEKPSRKLPDLPTGGSGADAEMDFDG